MTPEQVFYLFELLEKIIFLLQASCQFLACACGFAMMQLIIHAKNQRHMF